MTEFNPPIATRTTPELLKIVGEVNKWKEDAVERAAGELKRRNVSKEEIAHAKYLSKREEQYEDLKRAKESYTVFDFIDKPIWTIFEVLFSWELKKDGFLKKAEQQKKLRIVLGIIILGLVIYARVRT